MNRTLSGFFTFLKSFAVAAVWLGVCGFCFSYTGHTFFQLSICVLSSVTLTALLYIFDRDGRSIGLAQLIFVCLWLVCALGYQLKLQRAQVWPGYWIYCFYFDSLLTQGTIWLCSSLFFAAFRLIARMREARRFFLYSSVAFLIFYSFLIIYSFYLVRTKPGDSYPLNLNLTTTVQMYREMIRNNPYEIWMMILGNMFYFTPLGYIFYIALRGLPAVRRRIIILLFAPVAFFLLEYSQYVFQTGYCEIDDMVMNALGFWLGAILAPLSDIAAKRISKGSISRFWL